MKVLLYGISMMGIGLSVVFVMLTILIGCIMIMSWVFNKIKKSKEEKAKAAAAAPKAAVTCPYCGATTTPDASGCCEYCGGAVNS